jgi:hypothetical protein
MKTKEIIETKAEIVTLKFKVPKSFKDPLKIITNEDSFDEIGVEEWSHYYNIHIGLPVKEEV